MRRWRHGQLSDSEVRDFAAQYGLAVGALADTATTVALVVPIDWRHVLNEYAAEQRTQHAIWHKALDELGVRRPSVPTGETRRCVSVWSRVPVDDPMVGLTMLFALESTQAATAPDLLDWSAQHIVADVPSLNEYWQRQAERAPVHARALRALLTPLVEAPASHQALGAAEAALAAWWELLNGVDRTAH
jgi:hypothetical protein